MASSAEKGVSDGPESSVSQLPFNPVLQCVDGKAREAVKHRSDDVELDPQNLVDLVQEGDGEVLQKLGDVEHGLDLLGLSLEQGVKDDDLEESHKLFGSKIYSRNPPRTMFNCLIDEFNICVLALIICALTTSALAFIKKPPTDWQDGVAIIVFVLLATLIKAIAKYWQNCCFLGNDINTGDHQAAGDRSSLSGETELTCISSGEPFPLYATSVCAGHGQTVVTEVEMSTECSQLNNAQRGTIVEETPLQARVKVGSYVRIVGLCVAIIVLLVSLIFPLVKEKRFSVKFKPHTLSSLARKVEVALAIMVVAVPEGLPQAVAVILARTKKRMMADGALVRRPAALESLGSVTCICTDITGTLTPLGGMVVTKACRPEVPEAVRQCQMAGVKVRMLTGDDLTTANAVAVDCGILRDGDLAIEGSTFQDYDHETRVRLLPKIAVMAASSLSDKSLMVNTLREQGEVVAVIDGGADDAPVLCQADTGLATGNQPAKECSDITIMDESFASVLDPLKWGRSHFPTLQKYLQFQLTPRLTVIVVIVVIVFCTGQTSLTVVQLLWIDFLLDPLGALVFAGEPRSDSVLMGSPIKAEEPLISIVMWANIIPQFLYQVTVLLLWQFRVIPSSIFGDSGAGKVTETVMFNVIVLCQLTGLVNARKMKEMNIFQGVLDNRVLLGIAGGALISQVLLVECLNMFASTVKLSWQLWLVCLGIGGLCWPIGCLFKLVPLPLKLTLAGPQHRLKKSKQQGRAVSIARKYCSSAAVSHNTPSC